jgi:integrase
VPSAYVQKRKAKDGTLRYRAVLERSHNGKRLPKIYGSWCPYWKKANKEAGHLLSGSYDKKMGLKADAGEHVLSELLESWRGSRTALAESTRTQHDATMAEDALEFYGDIYLHEITPESITKFRAWLLEKYPSPATASMRLRSLTTCLNYGLYQLEWIGRNPAARIKQPPQDDVERVYTDAEYWLFFEASPPKLRGALILAAHRGMRRREIAMLPQELLTRDAEGEVYARLQNPKRRGIDSELRIKTRRKGEREVHIPADALPYMNLTGGGPCFPHLAGYPGSINKLWGPVVKKLQAEGKISGRCRWHDWKHTAITKLYESGASDADVMRMTGNTLASLQRYAHIRRKAHKDVVGRVNYVIPPPSKSPSTEGLDAESSSVKPNSPSRSNGQKKQFSSKSPAFNAGQTVTGPVETCSTIRCPSCGHSGPVVSFPSHSGSLDSEPPPRTPPPANVAEGSGD